MAGAKYPLTIRYRGEMQDAKNLAKVAAYYGRTESDVLRLLVAQAAVRVDEERAKAKAKKGHAVATDKAVATE